MIEALAGVAAALAEGEGSPTAQPDRITAIVLDDPQAAIAMLGLVRITETGVAL